MAIKVLVVDDSVFMRKLITRLIEEDDSLEVTGTAKNGLEAIELVFKLQPDVITLDIEMPGMNGLEALSRIMKERPTPIIMLSSLTQEGANETIEALQGGAVDFIPKPSGSVSVDLFKVKEELNAKIKAAARVSLLPARSFSRGDVLSVSRRPVAPIAQITDLTQMIALGTSTGGPRALETVISALPAGFPVPLLVVQHMPPKFTLSLAQRLDRMSRVNVVEAKHNERIVGGTVYIAPGDHHMSVVRKGKEYWTLLHQRPPRNGHRPSVDVLFESVAQLAGIKRHYVLLTGMGQDGAEGMLTAKRQGAHSTLAESEESCVVFGMPKAAIEKQCVDFVVPLHKIAAKLISLTHS